MTDSFGFLTITYLGFPSYNEIKNEIEKEHGKNGNITILNIFEFKNKKDFDSFNS